MGMIPHSKLNRDAVAQMAGVSSATVSRVYNHPEQVAESTARKVRKAAEKVGYVLDQNASALRRGGSGVILFCQERVPGHRADRYYKWFYADVLLAIITRLDKTPYRLRIQPYEKVSEIKAVVDSGQADGIIGYGVHTTATVAAINRLGVPYVCGHQLVHSSPQMNVVVVDERHGGAIAGIALRDSGLRRPAHITGALDSLNVCRLRWRGFQSVFPERHIPLINHGLGIKAGREAAAKILPLVHQKTIDSVFVVNDLTALGVVQVLLANGVRIPEDISVVAYDNLPFIDALPVRLTTVDINLGGLYRCATGLLLETMRTGSPAAAMHHPLLVPGESVKKC